jgi:5-amino-6-(5-phosphoribosylamino)uracil reductase
MGSHPIHVIVQCAMSVDGFIDDGSPERLLLSGAEDLARVDEVRAGCDAILVGAGTIRADNPALLIRSEERQQSRMARGLPRHPLKVTVTRTGQLHADARFFTLGDSARVVYCARGAAPGLQGILGSRAMVVGSGEDGVDPRFILRDLAARGVRRLLIEGGSSVATLFLSAGLVDELQMAIAPLFVGDDRAPRFVQPGRYPHDKSNRMHLSRVERVGDVAVLTFQLQRAPE